MSEARDDLTEHGSMKYEITEPTMADAVTIGPMHLRSWIETYQNPELGVDEEWIRENVGFVAAQSGTDFRTEIFERINNGEPIFYRVAKDESGSIIGFVMATKNTTNENEPNVLDALYTLKDVQGQGLGSNLMKIALDWLESEKPVKLEVISYNQHAIDFYKKYGFELTGKKLAWKEPVEAAEMVKS